MNGNGSENPPETNWFSTEIKKKIGFLLNSMELGKKLLKLVKT